MKIRPDDIKCMILASGASHRFGSAKMLHCLADGLTILAKTIRIYAQVFEQVSVVVREGDDAIIQLVESERAVSIVNQHSDRGLSQSIIAGIQSTLPSRAWLIALGDMPYLSVLTVESLAQRVTAETIALPRTRSGLGNPVAIGTYFKEELQNLQGDVGAKPLLIRHADSLSFYDCDDLGVHQDIDKPSDIVLR